MNCAKCKGSGFDGRLVCGECSGTGRETAKDQAVSSLVPVSNPEPKPEPEPETKWFKGLLHKVRVPGLVVRRPLPFEPIEVPARSRGSSYIQIQRPFRPTALLVDPMSSGLFFTIRIGSMNHWQNPCPVSSFILDDWSGEEPIPERCRFDHEPISPGYRIEAILENPADHAITFAANFLGRELRDSA